MRQMAAALLLMTATPAWAADTSLEGLTEAREVRSETGSLAFGQIAQAAGASDTETMDPARDPGKAEHPEGLSNTDLNRALSNPVTSLWSLQSQFNNYQLANGRWNANWQFQPVLPVSLTRDWNLITRPVFQLYNIVPHETTPGNFETTTGFGDTILLTLLSPAHSGKWILGAGPTFIFPTASSTFTGQGKWQAGPGVVVGYLSEKFILGVFPQQWWSIGGDADRPATSQLNLQPIASYFFGDGWNIAYSGNILANWKASSGNVWTVPVGIGIGKVLKLGRLPIKLEVGLQYMPVHPADTGQKWNVQLQVTPVIPKLVKGAIFE